LTDEKIGIVALALIESKFLTQSLFTRGVPQAVI